MIFVYLCKSITRKLRQLSELPGLLPYCVLLLLMDDDAATSNLRSSVRVVGFTNLVIVDHFFGILVPYLDAELVDTSATVYLAISSGEHKSVLALTVDGPSALELSMGPSDNQTLVAVGVEVEVGYLELGLCLPCGYICSFLVLGHVHIWD